MNERMEALQKMIRDGKEAAVVGIIQAVTNYHEGEEFVFAVLREEKSTPALVDVALNAFLKTRENRYRKHGGWVHSLSHFTEILWKRRMDSWIKKFNEVAFKGAIELDDSNCSDRLVGDFAYYAKWDDNPTDFHLTPENLTWMNWQYFRYGKARIEAYPFASEIDFLVWTIKQPEMQIWEYDKENNIIAKTVRSILNRLNELGADTSEFQNLEKEILSNFLKEQEEALTQAKNDWDREYAEKSIARVKAALQKLENV